jgi:cytoskeletal protein CcmA (bactofilin family)
LSADPAPQWRFPDIETPARLDRADAFSPYRLKALTFAHPTPTKDCFMFSKPADPTTPPTRPTSGNISSNNRSILSSDLKITGDISSTGTIEVLGEIEGTVAAQGLVIGSEGRVSGQVSAETVEVKGTLAGRVDSQTFTLRAAAHVTADISYTTLIIESGAQIEGRFTKAKA